MAKTMKLWDKGIPANKLVEQFTVGDDYLLDNELVPYDCRASIAHAKMLGKIGILNAGEVRQLAACLKEIQNMHKTKKFVILPEHEDCHTAIENYLIDKLGDLGKKIHTGRSRNDQVLTALRLYYKDELTLLNNLSEIYVKSLRKCINKYGKIKFSGYTHTRKAMPTSIKVWAGAFIDAMRDNRKLMNTAIDLIDQSPLGSGAGYGVPLELDRNFTASQLSFKRVQTNPIYVQMSRGKFESTILHSLTQIMFDLNKMAMDLIFFSIPELAYFEIPAAFCTGSSIMPQKKNPDVLELIRAKYHKIVAFEFEIKNIIANLISGYNRDLQETKKPVLKAFVVVRQSLNIMALLIEGLKVNHEKCSASLSEEVYATGRVYDLVKKGVPFREAYKIISTRYC
jgi:argininosuccinate lyase